MTIMLNVSTKSMNKILTYESLMSSESCAEGGGDYINGGLTSMQTGGVQTGGEDGFNVLHDLKHFTMMVVSAKGR